MWTLCRWPLLTVKSGRTPAMTPPLCHLSRLMKHALVWTRNGCESSLKLSKSSAWTGRPQKSPPAANSTSGSCSQGAANRPLASGQPLSSWKSIRNSLRRRTPCNRHASTLLLRPLSPRLTAPNKRATKLPSVEKAVAAHLCPPMANGWKSKTAHPSKPCRTTSALASRVFTADCQATSALHTVAVLQVYQAKHLHSVWMSLDLNRLCLMSCAVLKTWPCAPLKPLPKPSVVGSGVPHVA